MYCRQKLGKAALCMRARPIMTAIDTLNKNVVEAKYAVRGPILEEATRLEKQLKETPGSLPFESIVACNIGNPQALKQKPISFSREVLSLVICPSLLDRAKSLGFQVDAINRAEKYLAAVAPASGIGAYTASQGIDVIRNEVAKFISTRDGHHSDPCNIFLTDGASAGVKLVMQLLLRPPTSGFQDGILCPIPQYPLYSALSTVLESKLVPYYLNEDKGWGLSVDKLQSSLDTARENGITVRSLVVINPGNPTGQTLPEESMKDIITFCSKEKLVLCADEVYQENIWNDARPFCSFKKVACDMGYTDDNKNFQLVSFHSTSKGFSGECGLRGGYMEVHGFDDDVKQQMIKLASISLCSNTVGQLSTGLMVNPPKPGEASFSVYQLERDTILKSLKKRAANVTQKLNELDGVSCNKSDGAMYAFPRITIPTKACEAAAKDDVAPDAFYCMELLKNTGIVVVPGSGFGQETGTWHFRTTFLPPEDEMDEVMNRLKKFHSNFMEKYN